MCDLGGKWCSNVDIKNIHNSVSKQCAAKFEEEKKNTIILKAVSFTHKALVVL